MSVIRSRENPRVKAWMRLADDPRERRKRGLALIEGLHLVEAFLQEGGVPASLIVAEGAMEKPEIGALVERASVAPVILADAIFRRISDAETPIGIAAEIEVPAARIDPAGSDGCVFLDGLQDAGNVGTLLRSAAAFGVRDAFVGPGCADPWSPKALRAGMGGHFFLRIALSGDLAADVRRFGQRTICAEAHGGARLESLDLGGRVGWIFGSEARGASASVAEAASLKATISTPGGAESLNVAASAAICLYERQRQLEGRVNTRGARS
jgi:TrmH family RNA methyltransferase